MLGKKKSTLDETQSDHNSAPADLPAQVDVYTLPEKFLPHTKPQAGSKKNNKLLFILLGFLAVVIVGGAVVWFYFNNKSPETTPSPSANIAPLDQVNENEQSVEDSVSRADPEPIIHVAKDLQDEVIGILSLDLRTADADIVDQIDISSTRSQVQDSKVVGAIYRVTPAGYSLQETAILKISYLDTNLSSIVENSLRVGYEGAGGQWQPAEDSRVDLNKNEVSLDISQLPRTRVALVSNLTKNDADQANQTDTDTDNYEINELQPSLDTDEDQLTDIEEIMYGTVLNQPDSDSDGYTDGQEMLNFYSPLAKDQKLSEADLFTTYQNDKYQYELIYPKNWSPSSVADDDSVIIFTSPTNQFFQVVVERKNQDIASIVEWYLRQLPGIDQDALRHTVVGPDKIEAIYSLDGATIYFLYNDLVVALSYNLGIEKQADYLTTWKVMLNSWKIIKTPSEAGLVDGVSADVGNNSTATSTQ